jgi:GTP-sensing pleiotropic transcriptional regulator CodY
MSEVKAYDPYISTTVVGTVAAMAERRLGGFVMKVDHDKLTEENKMLREALSAIASMSTDRKSIQVATEALEQIK